MRYLSETLAATDEASPHPLAMTEGRRKHEWGEVDDEGLRGAVPTAPLLIKDGIGARPPLSANPAH